MPRVKFDYVVSFSSEDPENRATNLLAAEVSKKKWLCNKGEPSCSVVLQLPRAIEISAVHIGAYHAALVEVLVGLSERPNDPFQVLVPSCVFVPPAQSRRDEGVDRVRSFSGEELAADTRGKRYDRVRVVCSQPYNKHCQYGLSFVHIHEPESRNDPVPPTPSAPAVPSRMFALDTYSSDEEEFRPGELFAKHLKSPSTDNPVNTSTDAQIRQATSYALKNISDPSTKILKTPISKAGSSRQKQSDHVPANRQRDSIMYNDDDDKPHEKIDHVVNRHKDEKSKDDELNKTKERDQNREIANRMSESTKNKERNNGTGDNSKIYSDNKHNKTMNDSPNSSRNKKKMREASNDRQSNSEHSSNKKRKRDNDDDTETDVSDRIGAVCKDVSKILDGVTLVLSGYEGARRTKIREVSLVLGARYSPNWTPQCTHLICAFPNTPKLRTARASAAHVAVVTADWLDECLRYRRRLPWRWYATVPAERKPIQPMPKEPKVEEEALSDGNTDDEIENAMVKIAAQTTRESTSSPTEVCFVKDERFKGHYTLLDSDEEDNTEVEDFGSIEEKIDPEKALPDFFDGYTFVITDGVVDKAERDLLARYVRAFGGLLIEESELDEDTTVDYKICAESSAVDKQNGCTLVRPSWVWRCGRERRLCAPKDVPVTT